MQTKSLGGLKKDPSEAASESMLGRMKNRSTVGVIIAHVVVILGIVVLSHFSPSKKTAAKKLATEKSSSKVNSSTPSPNTDTVITNEMLDELVQEMWEDEGPQVVTSIPKPMEQKGEELIKSIQKKIDVPWLVPGEKVILTINEAKFRPSAGDQEKEKPDPKIIALNKREKKMGIGKKPITMEVLVHECDDRHLCVFWSPTGSYADVQFEYDWYWSDPSGTWRYATDSDKLKQTTLATGAWYLEQPKSTDDSVPNKLSGYQTNTALPNGSAWRQITLSRVKDSRVVKK
jgi:hypothetical protein